MKKINALIVAMLFTGYVNAWEAKVVNILQHGDVAAIALSPNPGPGNCDVGSPYILIVDVTPAAEQRFSMLLTALVSGKKVQGWADACSTAIWGDSRPTIRRLRLTNQN